MTRSILLLTIALTAAAHAAEPTVPSAASGEGSKRLHASVATTRDGEPTKKFLTGATKIYGRWKGETLKTGDLVQAVWIAESFGYPQKDARITEGEVTAYKPDDDGVFSLARPEGGWPIGRYRLEFYVRGKLAETVRFTIEQDVTVEVR